MAKPVDKAAKALKARIYRAANREKIKEYNRLYRAAHQEEIRAQQAGVGPERRRKKAASNKAYRLAHLEELRRHDREYRIIHKERYKLLSKGHREKHRDKINQRRKEWGKNNQSKVRELNRTRALKKRGLVHPELDQAKMVLLKEECQRLTLATGEQHQLDHIIPLDLGGWHHQDNMQPLPARLNRSKSNDPVWEHPGYKSWRDVPPQLWPHNLARFYHNLLIE